MTEYHDIQAANYLDTRRNIAEREAGEAALLNARAMAVSVAAHPPAPRQPTADEKLQQLAAASQTPQRDLDNAQILHQAMRARRGLPSVEVTQNTPIDPATGLPRQTS